MFCHYRLVMLIVALTLDGQVTRGIFGGHEAVPHSRPYMVLLEMHLKDSTTKYCSGFLLSEDLVMTAAQCQAETYTVFLGLHNYNKHRHHETQIIYVEAGFPHQNYDPEKGLNDVMLLKLKSKANFNKHVKSIAIADQDNGSLPKSCIVSGWGRSNKHNGFMSTVLMEVNVTLIDDESCTKMDVYCSEGETGPRKGDGGSPLVCGDGKVYGVASFLKQKGSDGPTSTYTNIAQSGAQIDWITEPTSYVCVTGVQ